MKLYLVRHGEHKSIGHHSTNDVELSADGLRQAKQVANRFRDIPIDVIISSNLTRAQQTAEEIGRTINKKIFYTELLVEWKIVSSLIGLKLDDPEAIHIKEVLRKNAKLSDWHLADEENFIDFAKRVYQFFQYLTMFKEENILVVTHAATLRMIVSQMLFSESLTHEMFYQINDTFKTINTGITVCEQDEKGKWNLITWNDHAHLG